MIITASNTHIILGHGQTIGTISYEDLYDLTGSSRLVTFLKDRTKTGCITKVDVRRSNSNHGTPRILVHPVLPKKGDRIICVEEYETDCPYEVIEVKNDEVLLRPDSTIYSLICYKDKTQWEDWVYII